MLTTEQVWGVDPVRTPSVLPLPSLGQGEYSHYGTSSNVVDMDGSGSSEEAGSYLITKPSILTIRTLIGM